MSIAARAGGGRGFQSWAGLLVVAACGMVPGCGRRQPSDAELMERALSGATELDRESATVLLGRRGAAELKATPRARLAGFLDASPNVGRLRTLLGQAADPTVQGAAALGLAAMRDIDSIPAIMDLMDSPAPVVRQRSGQAVAELMGIPLPFDANGEAAARAKAIAAYRHEYDRTFGPKAKHGAAARRAMGPLGMFPDSESSQEEGGSP